jgi:hypothetical protein
MGFGLCGAPPISGGRVTLYIVVRNDISAGLMMAQACHAAREYTLHSREDPGDNLVCLQASPTQLFGLVVRAACEGTSALPFFEPDLHGALTAAAFGSGAKKLLSQLPLALRADPREIVIRDPDT